MTKKDSIKMAVCGVLAGLAVVLAVTAVTDIGSRAEAAQAQSQYSENADGVYVLKNDGGYVAIYTEASQKKPVTVTNIEVNSLPEADRALLGQGISVYGWDELQQILEDLGS